MKPAFLEKITLEKVLIYALIAAVLITFGFVSYLIVTHFTKSIKITSPTGGEELEIQKTYEITWKARGVDKVGIALFKGKEPQWIAKDVYANLGKYQWKVYPGQAYGNDYWIAIFEYPWKNGNKITYSGGSFAITYNDLLGCDSLSIQSEWPYVPSDLPDLRKVFITSNSYSGNLGGLDGADKKCQAEADGMQLGGKWIAFLGGDAEQDLAVERLKRTTRGLDGTFVQFEPKTPETTLTRGAICYRLLGKDINEFLKKFSDLSLLNQGKFDQAFLNDFGNVWLGRATEKSMEHCDTIFSVFSNPYVSIAEKYSYTATCQNWTSEQKLADGYPVPRGQSKPPFPVCYTAPGRSTDAVAVGGLATGLTGGAENVNSFTPYQGKYCNISQKLLCIEQ